MEALPKRTFVLAQAIGACLASEQILSHFFLLTMTLESTFFFSCVLNCDSSVPCLSAIIHAI